MLPNLQGASLSDAGIESSGAIVEGSDLNAELPSTGAFNDESHEVGLENPFESHLPREPADTRAMFAGTAQNLYTGDSALIGHDGLPVESGSGGVQPPAQIQQPGEAEEEVQASNEGLAEIPDSIIEVHFLVTLAHLSENNVWSYLDLNISVTQNYETDPSDTSPPPDNSAQTSQKLLENSGPEGKHLKEISVRITIKNTPKTAKRRYKFQLLGSVNENAEAIQDLQVQGKFCWWTSLQTIVFINFPDTKQTLRPITRNIGRELLTNRLLIGEKDFFLGSFAFDGDRLHHVSPSDTVLRQRDESHPTASVPPAILAGDEQVIIVDKADRVYEARKARAGRPSHRDTGQLLMTRPQAEKIIEIRERWQGLTPRQRRNHVREEDFYSFLTLNRDEAARILPVCTTWFKDVIRLQGVKVWPGRPLRRSGAALEELKAELQSQQAALNYVIPNSAEEGKCRQKISRLQDEIDNKLKARLDIVRKNVSSIYFEKYKAKNGERYLNPEWEALPPPTPDHERP